MGRPQLPGSKPGQGGEEMLEMILELVLMILRIAKAVIELVSSQNVEPHSPKCSSV